MNNEQSKTCLALLVENFPQADLTEAEMRVFMKGIEPFTENVVSGAIMSHRLKNKYPRPDFDEILKISKSGEHDPRKAMIDRQSMERAQEMERWKKQQEEIDKILLDIQADAIPELIQQYGREFPVRKEIDPKTHRAFRAWLYDFWKKADAGRRGAA